MSIYNQHTLLCVYHSPTHSLSEVLSLCRLVGLWPFQQESGKSLRGKVTKADQGLKSSVRKLRRGEIMFSRRSVQKRKSCPTYFISNIWVPFTLVWTCLMSRLHLGLLQTGTRGIKMHRFASLLQQKAPLKICDVKFNILNKLWASFTNSSSGEISS